MRAVLLIWMHAICFFLYACFFFLKIPNSQIHLRTSPTNQALGFDSFGLSPCKHPLWSSACVWVEETCFYFSHPEVGPRPRPFRLIECSCFYRKMWNPDLVSESLIKSSFKQRLPWQLRIWFKAVRERVLERCVSVLLIKAFLWQGAALLSHPGAFQGC